MTQTAAGTPIARALPLSTATQGPPMRAQHQQAHDEEGDGVDQAGGVAQSLELVDGQRRDDERGHLAEEEQPAREIVTGKKLLNRVVRNHTHDSAAMLSRAATAVPSDGRVR